MLWKAFVFACVTLTLLLTACASAAQELPESVPVSAQSATSSSDPAALQAESPVDAVGEIQPETAVPELETLAAQAALPTADPLVAYVREGSIWVDAGQAGAWQVTSGSRDDAPLFDPDGQWILFQRGLEPVDGTELWELWIARVDGGLEMRIAGPDTLLAGDQDARLPVNPAWSSDGASIAFETRSACVDCAPLDDLWIYYLVSGEMRRLLVDEEGGGFAFSPDGQSLAVSSRTELFVMDTGGQNRRTLLVYDPIIYLSGFHYPRTAWTPDGQAILAAVPPEDQMQLLMGQAPPGMENRTSLWRLWLDGEADLLAQLPLVRDGDWSPDRSLYAYSEIGTARLAIVTLQDGSLVYESAGLFQGWNPDNHHFTFLPDLPGNTFWLNDTVLGCLDSIASELVSPQEAAGIRPPTWVDPLRFVYLAKIGQSEEGDGFELRLKTLEGETRLIYTSFERADSMAFAVYSPRTSE